MIGRWLTVRAVPESTFFLFLEAEDLKIFPSERFMQGFMDTAKVGLYYIIPLTFGNIISENLLFKVQK